LIALAGLFAVSLAAFYGLYSSAGDPMERDLFPVSPFLAIAWAWAIGQLVARPVVGSAALAGVLALAVAANAQLYESGDAQMRFEVVRWVDANVPDDVWVGAEQTGALGFFHDRTVSLDGAVNPAALAARRRGALIDYIVAKRLPYIADWAGAIRFMREPRLAERYEVLVHDPDRNLCVLKLDSGEADAPERRDGPPDSADDQRG